MDMYVWDNFNSDQLNEKIIFFYDLWEEICDEIDNPQFDFDFSTLHILVIELLDEIDFNKLKKKENKFYYRDCIGKIYGNDKSIKGKLKYQLQILLKELESPRLDFIKYLLIDIKDEIEKGSLFNESFHILKDSLLNSNTINECIEDIKYYTKIIIIEFLLKGYALKTTKEIIKNIFSTYNIHNKDTIITNYPHSVNFNDYKDNYTDYNLAIKSEIDSLTIENRIYKLLFLFNKTEDTFYYIFYITGITGEYEHTINNVT